jgi:hypothetical protein
MNTPLEYMLTAIVVYEFVIRAVKVYRLLYKLFG